MGAIAMRFGTVRPFNAMGRDRISAARVAGDAESVTEVFLLKYRKARIRN
ncbi:hypothetical protein GCM10018773_31020 [Streptomyces candidus]|nr:hypothetical protein GCM10018773_31020 [Streptomyces candidus]